MRTVTLSVVFVFVLSVMASAQSPFSTQSHVIHFGVGFGEKDEFAADATPFVGLSYEQGLVDDLGIGNLAVGGLVGAKYFYGNNLDNNLTRMLVAGKVTYHFNFVNSYNFDFYVGGLGGLFFWLSNPEEISNAKTDFDFGAFAGIHYFFSDRFGIYCEAGYGLGFINGGLAINF